jgi:heat shock protein HslJ
MEAMVRPKGFFCVVLALMAAPGAQAQPVSHSSGFPISKQFTLNSINGKANGNRPQTLVIGLAGNGNPYAAGFAGCHGWFGQIAKLDHVQLKIDRINVTQGQPRGPCNPDQQKGEEIFLAALKQVTAWSVDQQTLILTWDSGNNMRLAVAPAR